MSLRGPFSSRACIVCGRENEVGLRLAFWAGDGSSRAEWVVAPQFCGIPGYLHGGLILALLDDAMWYAAYGDGGFTMTAEAGVRYRAPVRAGQRVEVLGRVVGRSGRLWRLAAELREAGGRLLATAEGKFLEVPPSELGLQGE
jgi:uncharacterized protein (TIGR00369 family)